MIKKALVAGTVLIVLPAALWITDPGGHVSTMFGYVSEQWEPSLEYEIRRAENLIEQLDGDKGLIVKHKEQLAREKVLLGKLEEKLEVYQEEAARERAKLVAMRNRLGNGERLVSVDESTTAQLQRQLNRAQLSERKAVSTQRQYDARKKHFEALKDKVKEMDAQLVDMKLALDSLKAELTAVQLDEMQAKQSIDDSDFARVQKLLDHIDTEIKTRMEFANMQNGNYGDKEDEPVPPTSAADTVADVDAYLQSSDGHRVAEK